jgi:hypothetical protein
MATAKHTPSAPGEADKLIATKPDCSPGRCTGRSHGSLGAYSGRIRATFSANQE